MWLEGNHLHDGQWWHLRKRRNLLFVFMLVYSVVRWIPVGPEIAGISGNQSAASYETLHFSSMTGRTPIGCLIFPTVSGKIRPDRNP